MSAFGLFTIDQYENQNSEYEGLIIDITERKVKVRSRLAKNTPKKNGYFVTFWEKDDNQQNQPFNDNNSPEQLAILISDDNYQGVFVFNKEDAIAHGILSYNHIKGKMSMRFYPPWCRNLNQTALTTQKWQLKYFKDYSIDSNKT